MLIETPRLLLRPWTDRDAEPFAAMNADPEVMRFFPALLGRAASDALIGRLIARAGVQGIGYQAVERRSDGAFVGMIGLSRVDFPDTPIRDAVELGWRLARAAWGHGYATEGAAACAAHAFAALDIREVIAFTARPNLPSQAVMRRLGMRHDPARDFDHPGIPEGHPLRPHVTFALSRADWAARG